MAVESTLQPLRTKLGRRARPDAGDDPACHTDKYENFGGHHAAFDPLAMLRVGVAILQDYVRVTGSVEGALKYYVGAASLNSDGGYASKVMAERRRLRQVAGSTTPTTSTRPALVAKRLITPEAARPRRPWPPATCRTTAPLARSSNL